MASSKIDSQSLGLARPIFQAKVQQALGGRWEVEATDLRTDLDSERHFLPNLETYTRMIEAKNALVCASLDEQAERQQEVEQASRQFLQIQDPAAMGILEAGLGFARDELAGATPTLKPRLQPHELRSLGDGVFAVSMGFLFPLPDDQGWSVRDKGVLFFDTTPGEPGMSVAWARRA